MFRLLTRDVALTGRMAFMTDKSSDTGRDDADKPDEIEEADEEVAEGHPTDPDPLVEK